MAADEVSLDLEELRHLETVAKRPRVRELISAEIRSLEDKLSKEAVAAPTKQAPAPISQALRVPSRPAVNYVTLDSFSWEQDSDKIKLYISLEGVDEEKMVMELKAMSFDIKFHDVGGKNYRCAIPKLHKEILPEKCKVQVKPLRVVVTLVKASKGHWLDLHFKEDKLKPGLGKGGDPMAGIMDMMKNMYEDGDEETKRTIAKAWTQARSGNMADPLKDFK